MNEALNAGVPYKGHTIKVKRDFGAGFHLIDGLPCAWGYVVTQQGCNVMPGATWFQTVEDAKDAIDIWIAVGGPESVKRTLAGEKHDPTPGDNFWRHIRAMKAHMESARQTYMRANGMRCQ